MHRRASTFSRNKLDINSRVQVRIVRKRLKISEEQLNHLVKKAGDSIAAVRKEASSRQLLKLPQAQVPPAAVTAQKETATETQPALVSAA
ncbi:MAG: DUF3606 domain-containing protein [Bradyrhizobium sp.]|nr:DUF3606 domain-containing protein [Bradyrhizobium sp.]